MLVGDKNLTGKKKKNKSYAPKKVCVSRLRLKETPVAPKKEQPVSPASTDGRQNQGTQGFGKEKELDCQPSLKEQHQRSRSAILLQSTLERYRTRQSNRFQHSQTQDKSGAPRQQGLQGHHINANNRIQN